MWRFWSRMAILAGLDTVLGGSASRFGVKKGPDGSRRGLASENRLFRAKVHDFWEIWPGGGARAKRGGPKWEPGKIGGLGRGSKWGGTLQNGCFWIPL